MSLFWILSGAYFAASEPTSLQTLQETVSGGESTQTLYLSKVQINKYVL